MEIMIRMPQSWKALYNLMRDTRFAIRDFINGNSTPDEFDRDIQNLKTDYTDITVDMYKMIVYLITDGVNIVMQDYKKYQYDKNNGKDKLDKLSKELLACMKLQWKLQLKMKKFEDRDKLMQDIAAKTKYFNKREDSLYTTVGLFLLSRAALILNPSIAQSI